MAIPGQLLTGLYVQPQDGDGVPYAGAKLYWYAAGTSTPQDTYSDADLTTPNANPMIADVNGVFGPIYLDTSLGYKWVLDDADDVQIDTQDDVIDVAAFLFSQLAGVAGSKAVNSGYTIAEADDLVTVASTGGASPCLINLPAATDRDRPVIIKNMGTEPLAITPDGTDTIEGLAAAFAVAAASSPTFPTLTLASDGVSAWYVTSSHGL